MTPLVFSRVITEIGRLPVSKRGLPPNRWVYGTAVLDNVRYKDIESVVVPFPPLEPEPHVSCVIPTVENQVRHPVTYDVVARREKTQLRNVVYYEIRLPAS